MRNGGSYKDVLLETGGKTALTRVYVTFEVHITTPGSVFRIPLNMHALPLKGEKPTYFAFFVLVYF